MKTKLIGYVIDEWELLKKQEQSRRDVEQKRKMLRRGKGK